MILTMSKHDTENGSIWGAEAVDTGRPGVHVIKQKLRIKTEKNLKYNSE